jgi:Trypsin-like peptidase domain/FHA domain
MVCGRAAILGSGAGLPVLAALFWLGPVQGRAADLEQMKNSTVRIICSANGSNYTGSGFVIGINVRTYVATAQHAAECYGKDHVQELFIVQSPGKRVLAEIVWSDARIDLAIVSVPGPLGRPTVTLAATPASAAGAQVWVTGFPAAADKLVQSGEMASPSVIGGTISLVVTGLNEVRYFEHTAPTLPGNSGSPVFDETWDVIGVVSKNAVAVTSPAADGRGAVTQVNTGLGAAVDVAELVPYLERLGIPYTTASTVTEMSITLIVLAAAVVVLLSAGGVLVATSSGRALLSGDTMVFTDSRTEARTARLRVLGGALAGIEAPILDRVILGRDPGKAHVVFPESDTSVSRRHCEIVFDIAGAHFEVRDLGSRNGTFVVRGDDAPRRLAPEVSERVDAGDRILVGSPRNSLVLELA